MLNGLQCGSQIFVNVGTFQKMLFILFLSVILTAMTSAVVLASGTNILTVSAAVLSKSKCKFNTANASFNFGALDPGNSSDVTQSASIQFVCNGSAPVAAFALTTDDGLYESGPGANRMRHTATTTAYLPYELQLSPAVGTVPKGVNQTLAITGTVRASNYRSAMAGSYSDTVVITLNP